MSNNAEPTVPVIEIEPGWYAEDVQTIQDCDDADAVLTEAIAIIEMQIAENKASIHPRNKEWLPRAQYALKMKRRAIQIVQTRRGQINRAAKANFQKTQDRAMLDLIKDRFPEQFHECAKLMKNANA